MGDFPVGEEAEKYRSEDEAIRKSVEAKGGGLSEPRGTVFRLWVFGSWGRGYFSQFSYGLVV